MNSAPCVGFYPWWPTNPYQVLLKRELNARGWRVIGDPPWRLLHLLLGRDGLDVIHVHWPHGLYCGMWSLLRVTLMLLAYRLLRNNIVWTVHELDAYESLHPRRDAAFRRLLMRLSRRLIVHSDHTRRELIRDYAYARPIDIARHPSYGDWYPDTLSRPQARAQLGLADACRVFLYFGYIKPYKGVESLLAAFATLPDPDLRLLVVGRPQDEATASRLRQMASTDPRVQTVLAYVPDAEVALYFRAADAAVLPFRQTQTSGSLLLALGFGCPVIAPEIASIPEYVDARSALFFDPDTPDDLVRALHAATRIDLAPFARAARERAADTDWRTMAAAHAAVYAGLTRKASHEP